MTKELSGELDYRIRYDVEHDLFHAQNVFSDEYITPTFVEYVQKLEQENKNLKTRLNAINLLTPELEKEARKKKQHIAELEKEKQDLEWQLQEVAKDNDNYQKENAELKEELKDANEKVVHLACNQKKINTTTVSDYPYSALKLEEAKEIIALGLRVCETSSIEYMNWYQKRAEQFINDLEK